MSPVTVRPLGWIPSFILHLHEDIVGIGSSKAKALNSGGFDYFQLQEDSECLGAVMVLIHCQSLHQQEDGSLDRAIPVLFQNSDISYGVRITDLTLNLLGPWQGNGTTRDISMQCSRAMCMVFFD